MELPNALKNIVNLTGKDTLLDTKIVNILSDFQAYQDCPSAKYIIKNLITANQMKDFFTLGKWGPDSENYLNQFIYSTGTNSNLATYIFKSISYALGNFNTIPLLDNNRVVNNLTPSINTSPEDITNLIDVRNSTDLAFTNFSARIIKTKVIILYFEITGKLPKDSDWVDPNVSVFVNGNIAKSHVFSTIFKRELKNGFAVRSEEIDLPIKANDISKLTLYMTF